MAKLTYLALTSLDGFIEDADGSFEWAEPSDEVHAFVNDLARPVGTQLYGRRMYETMIFWENDPDEGAFQGPSADFAKVWRAADKIVYSTTWAGPVPTRRTVIEPAFDPEAVRHIKESANGDLMIGGAGIAAEAFRAELVDECHLFLAPVTVGGGKRAMPDFRVDLALLDERRFADGTIYLRYRVAR